MLHFRLTFEMGMSRATLESGLGGKTIMSFVSEDEGAARARSEAFVSDVLAGPDVPLWARAALTRSDGATIWAWQTPYN